ncbi:MULTISPECIES: GspH/FimT family pseudopilin [unclassified Pseudomonas]|uniref:GspH/FimT family pseudopilin n=1 Tax=unclassified Pseudomonas TaxID=196821 RepID=UPI000BD3929F|nr:MULTISPECIES: GspH/FimT family pseudopilin [unclassified Pseudomonas]PVZ11314.1 type IV fimbrial biogenesis protein FimT [Pseudomonas sp. URIL14HWK12:I12]PVZ22312.1 type IV fimbrial biogenesis protein FimT [Pseudomonas sp. URIL14HWK12:I10]PVZ31564.1 type IV fimbrial biogenesis protein FimT [Pseudomonas sp. URIL14HWK12:I11]SNZ16561.1 type IV fimbrial biogenesis protein FimT [Pseudomonas sp. URIL14HWK12:I9]
MEGPRQSGWTLVELLGTCAVVIILAVLSLHTLPLLVEHQQRITLAEDLAQSLKSARLEAILRSQRVVLKPLEGGWSAGWQVLMPGEQQSPPLREALGIPSVRVVPTRNVQEQVAFDYLGRPALENNGALAASFHFCDARNPERHRRVIIARTGRVRISTAPPATVLCQGPLS